MAICTSTFAVFITGYAYYIKVIRYGETMDFGDAVWIFVILAVGVRLVVISAVDVYREHKQKCH